MILTKEHIEDFNTIAAFLASRDIKELTTSELKIGYHIEKVDLLILLGSSIIFSVEKAGEAMQNGIADELLIVGGIGHSTEYLRENIRKHPSYHQIEVEGKSEAEIFRDILVNYLKIDSEGITIENKSTNCGANASEALKTIKSLNKAPKSIILIQDPTMQLRSCASFKKEWRLEKEVTFINFSPFIPRLTLKGEVPCFEDENISGTWDITRYLSLLIGEISRLYDNEEGYGPKGKGFISHVDVPNEILQAYERLKMIYAGFLQVRNKI